MRDPAMLLSVARGDSPADLLLANARIIDVFGAGVFEANVAIVGDRIAGVGDYTAGREVIDMRGGFVAPGLIDAHMHVESTMLPPHEFARAVLPHGTTAVVCDPHEIANVHGLDGIRYMLTSARGTPMSFLFMLPSCVPATDLETSGARLTAADLASLMAEPDVIGLAEMMNFPGVIHGDAAVMDKLRLGCARRIDGHAPGLGGRALQAYLSTGISTDHECTTRAEAEEKLRLGMKILIREGTAARNLDALLPLVTPRNAHRFCFCTDDRHPDDLARQGHIDHVLRCAIERGLDPIIAIAMATLHPAQQYGQMDRGAVAPGFRADLIVFDDLSAPRVRMTLVGGRPAARDGRYVGPAMSPPPPPAGSVRLPAGFSAASLRAPTANAGDRARIRVIGLTDAQLTTESLVEPAPVRDGCLVADPGRDLAKLAVVERHRGGGAIGIGFVRGFGLRCGALASTVAHDSHNLLLLGVSDDDMFVAALAVADAGGGLAVARDGRVRALLPLPIAGLMSDRHAEEVIRLQDALRAAAADLGVRQRDPFMPLSFLSLPVIPHLKLTDRGLVDVDRFGFVPLEAGE